MRAFCINIHDSYCGALRIRRVRGIDCFGIVGKVKSGVLRQFAKIGTQKQKINRRRKKLHFQPMIDNSSNAILGNDGKVAVFALAPPYFVSHGCHNIINQSPEPIYLGM